VGLLDERSAAHLFLSAGVVRILTPVIANQSESPDVLKAALGALRNLSVEGESDGCERMMDQDLMAALVVVMRRLLTTDSKELNTSGLDVALVQALHLLCNLCENCERALKVVNKEELVMLLIPVLVSVGGGGENEKDVRLAVAQCLLVMADNNQTMSKHLSSNANQASFLRILITRQDATPKGVLLRTLVAGEFLFIN